MRSLLVLVLLAGCGSCRGERPGTTEESPPATETETPTPGALGTLRGVVRLAEGAALPTYPQEALEGGGPTADPPAECEGVDQAAARQPVTIRDGGLVNVMVTATGDQERFFAALGEWEPQERRVAIEDCRLQPAIVTATRGDTLVLENESDYPFMVAVGRTSFMEGLLKGTPRRIPLDQGGVKAIRCGFAAPCGRADVVVVYHPVHTVTGEGGRFELQVPAGQEVEIHGWHPLFQDTTVTVTVPRGETREIELTLSPSAEAEAEGVEAADGAEAEAAEESSDTDMAESMQPELF